MNMSEYENVADVDNQHSVSMIYDAINNVLETAGSFALLYFCPFCVQQYQYKFLLMDHLKAAHHQFLLQISDKILEFYQCPFCNGKFYGKHLTGRHALLQHPRVIAEVYLEGKGKSKGSPSCLFCGVKSKSISQNNLASHIEENHVLEFYDMFEGQFLSCDSKFMLDVSNPNNESLILNVENNFPETTIVPFDSQLEDFPESSVTNCMDLKELQEQLTNITSPPPIIQLNSNTPVLKSILKSGNKEKIKIESNAPSKRVLKFDLPSADDYLVNDSSFNDTLSFTDSKTTFNDDMYNDDKAMPPLHSSTPKSMHRKLDLQNIHIPGHYKSKVYNKIKQCKQDVKNNVDNDTKYFVFTCAGCHRQFCDIEHLIGHIKSSHKLSAMNLSRPIYQCGVCGIRFFNSTFLKKHVHLHSSHSMQKCIL